MGVDFLNNLCYLQTALFIINVLLIIFSNRVFNEIPNGFLRFLTFGVILYFLTNILTPITRAVMPNLVTQHKPKVKKVDETVEPKKEQEWKFNGDYFNETCTNNKKENHEYRHFEPGD